MIHTWWWSSSDDLDLMMIQQWRSRLDDDPTVMIQTWWWYSDAPDQVMIQTWWWSSDDLDLMKMTRILRWLDDDLDDSEKNTCANKLCRENTFLVKRECWCISNSVMYSCVYLILYPDVPIGRIICISLYPDVPIGRFINKIKSCRVIKVNSLL